MYFINLYHGIRIMLIRYWFNLIIFCKSKIINYYWFLAHHHDMKDNNDKSYILWLDMDFDIFFYVYIAMYFINECFLNNDIFLDIQRKHIICCFNYFFLLVWQSTCKYMWIHIEICCNIKSIKFSIYYISLYIFYK